MKYPILLLYALFLLGHSALCQIGEYLGDESELYAQTKQVNQFILRFNGEESADGERLYPGEPYFRDPKVRRRYIELLFDAGQAGITPSKKKAFIDSVVPKQTSFLSLRSDQWFAEVNLKVRYNNKVEPLTLFLKIEQDGQGYRWSLYKAYFEPYARDFKKVRDQKDKPFLHPMSHELGFINLHKILRPGTDLTPYLHKQTPPDHLTKLLDDFRSGKATFQTVAETRFHVFQVAGWYFKLENIQRTGLNTGWLITDLTSLEPGDQSILTEYILKTKFWYYT